MGKRTKGKHGGKKAKKKKEPLGNPIRGAGPSGSHAALRAAQEIIGQKKFRASSTSDQRLRMQILQETLERSFGGLDFKGKAPHMVQKGYSIGSAFFWKVARPKKTLVSKKGPSNIRVLWHGTSLENMPSIRQQGLTLGTASCMFGPAVYVGTLSKALGYTGIGGNWFHHAEKGILLNCRVALGRVYEADGPLNKCPEGYDSVKGVSGKTESYFGTLNQDEWAIYDPRRISVQGIYLLERKMKS